VSDPTTAGPQRGDPGGARRVDGRVLRGTREGPRPVANQWVVLHRVGTDRAGPLDSMRTSGDGRFSVRYKMSGDTAAVYFVSTSYGGVAYFTSPLQGEFVSGDPATLTVFDTTSGPIKIAIGGRHIIVGGAQPNGRRTIGEVYDLQNDSTVTLVARDSLTPVWSAHVPATAVAFQLNANGDIAAGAVSRSGSTVQLFAPLSPGIRQFAFSYELPADAFPLAVPAERATGVFELLVQEQTARVHASGIALREMAPVNPDGRMFRRFLAQDVPANAIINVDMPRAIGGLREKVNIGVGLALFLAMVAALFVASRRTRPRAQFAGAPMVVDSLSQRLLRELASLDEAFEKNPAPDSGRAQYEERRAALKSELSEVLAAERRR
jgi:hypothetical protein